MAGEEFIKQGEIGDSAFVIMSGTCEVVIETAAGPLTVGTVGANQLVGEVALLHNGRRTATIRAETPVSCLLLSKDVFFHLLREFPDFSLAVMRDLAGRLERSTLQVRQARDEAKR
jgi:CRP-like cAMP-binding protein